MGFEKLKAYQAGEQLRRELDALCSNVSPAFSNVIRHIMEAADSVLLNIAEGSDSKYPAKRVLFYDTARNSANEVRAGLRSLQARGVFRARSAAKATMLAFTVVKLLRALIEEAQKRPVDK